ncbi:hypothetical protein N7474_008084 [Penicillium riverlandense]|uniref:uncharacterized protein n=1 Tax=Penicillium riverlandense TaxID=1903569 RepID=UPI0025478BB5|nr:uncharacterized protein N7474_008084 [Penicillium riverlandense]KAJ5811783.1 hypothetical protein N7474_008084 [Penicillium riverlandense]
MVIQIKDKTEIFKIPNYGGIPNVYFADYLGTVNEKANNPIAGAWFRIEKGPEATPPTYDYDEVGIVIEGEMTLRDKTGKSRTIGVGDTFYFPRGSTITFSSKSYGIAWKCGGRPVALSLKNRDAYHLTRLQTSDMSRSSREGFLWTLQGTLEGLTTDAVQKSSSTIQQNYDVIVIGAGFAGLIAARDLSQKLSLKILLLEARDRIGGRTWTAKVLGEELEMGGTWVHWAQPHLYSELRRYGLHTNLKTSAGTLAPEKQTFKPAVGPPEELPIHETAATLDRVAQSFFAVEALDSRALMPYPHEPLREPALWRKYDHWTVQDRLDQLEGFSQREKDIFESNLSTFGSAPGKDIGFTEALRWYALGGHSIAGVFELAGIYKVGKGGMTSFAQAILSDYAGELLFGTAVKTISQDTSGVKVVTTRGESLQAKMAISTIPLNCLGDVKFNPPLSSLRQSAIKEGHINKGAKIHFKLRTTEPGWFATASGSSDSSYVFAFSDHNGTQPAGPSGTWCIGFGYNFHLTNKKDHKHIINRFRTDIHHKADVEAYATHDWMNDPYAKGVWACWGPNSASRYLQELQKPHGRVIFASADWADGWRGFVDGAIERGQQAGQDVVTFLKTGSGSLQANL